MSYSMRRLKSTRSSGRPSPFRIKTTDLQRRPESSRMQLPPACGILYLPQVPIFFHGPGHRTHPAGTWSSGRSGDPKNLKAVFQRGYRMLRRENSDSHENSEKVLERDRDTGQAGDLRALRGTLPVRAHRGILHCLELDLCPLRTI